MMRGLKGVNNWKLHLKDADFQTHLLGRKASRVPIIYRCLCSTFHHVYVYKALKNVGPTPHTLAQHLDNVVPMYSSFVQESGCHLRRVAVQSFRHNFINLGLRPGVAGGRRPPSFIMLYSRSRGPAL